MLFPQMETGEPILRLLFFKVLTYVSLGLLPHRLNMITLVVVLTRESTVIESAWKMSATSRLKRP